MLKALLMTLVAGLSLIYSAKEATANIDLGSQKKNLIGTFGTDAQSCKNGYPIRVVKFGSGDSLLGRAFVKGADGKPVEISNTTYKNFRIGDKEKIIVDLETKFVSGEKKGQTLSRPNTELIVKTNSHRGPNDTVTWHNCSAITKAQGSQSKDPNQGASTPNRQVARSSGLIDLTSQGGSTGSCGALMHMMITSPLFDHLIDQQRALRGMDRAKYLGERDGMNHANAYNRVLNEFRRSTEGMVAQSLQQCARLGLY
jgi:hypothetical protein